MADPLEGPVSPPLHIARAYGVGGPSRPLAVRAVDSLPEFERAAGLRLTRDDQADTVQISGRPSMARIQRVVAATVPGRIDFTAGPPPAPSAGLPMYRHPADKNAAATGVNAGRVIDVRA